MGKAEEALRIDPPAPEWEERLLALYRLWDRPHGSGLWARDLKARLAGLAGTRDRFYAVPHGPQAAAALDVTVSPHLPALGIVHRVFTHPAARKKGLSLALLESAKTDFKALGGRMLLVNAPAEGAARGLYARAGFLEFASERDDVLLGWPARGRRTKASLMRLLTKKPVTWREAIPGDWAGLVAWSILGSGGGILDGEWIELFELQREKKLSLRVGESGHGYIVRLQAAGELPARLSGLLG